MVSGCSVGMRVVISYEGGQWMGEGFVGTSVVGYEAHLFLVVSKCRLLGLKLCEILDG